MVFMLYQTFSTQLYPWVRELERGNPRLMFDEPMWLVMFFLMGTIMIDPFVGLLKFDRSKNTPKSEFKDALTSRKKTKTLKKEITLRKGKSRSMFADRWKVLD